MPREKNIEKSIKDWLKEQKRIHKDIFFFKAHGNRFQRRGLPDLIGNVGPTAFYMELKKPTKELQKLQAAIRADIISTGGHARRIDNLEDAKKFILELRKLNGYTRRPRIRRRSTIWRESESLL